MKTELKKKLSKVEDFQDPRISLEQYVTPPELAADLLHAAEMQRDLEEVIDLGTGTGIFAIGAAVLDADVTAVEKDEEALEIAKKNAEKLGVREKIDFVNKDVREVTGERETVFMNPPFSQHTDLGMEFWARAVSLGEKIYAVSPATGREGIKSFIDSSNHRIVELENYTIDLPATYGFHTQESRETSVDLIITEATNNGN
ncbi:MAG: METTL5 family protein [Candidatus Nanohaloarchaea archaeon]